jgi:hypothetical protein
MELGNIPIHKEPCLRAAAAKRYEGCLFLVQARRSLFEFSTERPDPIVRNFISRVLDDNVSQ